MDADEVALRAKIRHDHLLSKRARAEALESDIREAQADLAILAREIVGKVDALRGRLQLLAGRLATHLRELDQEETTISCPALEPRLAPTDRIQPVHRAGKRLEGL